MTQITCKSCGRRLAPEDGLCPRCGSGDREIIASEQIGFLEMVRVDEYAPQRRDYQRRMKAGEKISGGSGRPAREHMIIDRVARRKYHHVEEQDESGKWRIVEHHDGPLSRKEGTVRSRRRQGKNPSKRERTRKRSLSVQRLIRIGFVCGRRDAYPFRFRTRTMDVPDRE